MIFGYTIDFCDEPSLNFPSSLSSSANTIEVKAFSLPSFENYTDYFSHSLQEVRYGFHRPMQETKGKHVEWTMEVKNILKLVWFPKRHTIGYEKLEGCTVECLRFWVYHTFLPLLFQMEGIYNILHVGSVEVKGKAVIFMAPSFGGKSTLTDYFLQQGHWLLSDDTLAIKEYADVTYRAIASWPFHRPYREPEVLGKEIDRFVTEPLEIAAIYRLEKSEPEREIKIEEISGIEKFKTVHYGTFIPLSFLMERTFAFHASFSKAVSVYRVTLPWDKNRLDEVYKKIVEHTM